ncbi:VOC family protein [Methylobacterium dankookense]|uniref:Catechol-2,3-dioxygenase n=1 Tax=Methylobacterium dankookense TaxID=560405 RepID=A0A564G1Y4_9HYPH|nr:VOC family protein [Methylobacterium dankookense]GJD54672.1 Catechol-2,3-dioxygenase [Methylobacterium dankookense]VUF14435.1 Catechol-2,3-dioxygenase [Methylobacterium dankookense]
MPHGATEPDDRQDPILATAPYGIAAVSLVARDRDGLARFYREAIGLAPVSEEGDILRLGVGDRVLLELRQDPAARPPGPYAAGLFHTAFLLPGRADLGAWLAHAAARGIRLSGASDHVVSEAVYLTDPEGNGIEIYADRPSAAWPRMPDGSVVMRTDPLDGPALVRAADGPWQGMPRGGVVGHIHLQVGALEPAERFYADLLGFDVTCRYPGALFLGAGGYHHQLAANIWNSRGAPVRVAGTTGLAEIALHADAAMLAGLRARCRQAGQPAGAGEGALVLDDPWGTRLRISAPGNAAA